MTLALLFLTAGCRTGRNYPSAEGPRYAGDPLAPAGAGTAGTLTVRVVSFTRLDHIFFKGFATVDSSETGTVEQVSGASDHLPVWAVAILR
jgi:endonuclease/exonuclease/phosphatase family metal-dependent hydrolase